jgi:hypothetical protein
MKGKQNIMSCVSQKDAHPFRERTFPPSGVISLKKANGLDALCLGEEKERNTDTHRESYEMLNVKLVLSLPFSLLSI